MKKSICLIALSIFCSPLAFGTTLEQALVQTYQTNPTLKSAREQAKATDELVPQALSGWRPSLFANGDLTYLDSDTDPEAPADGSNTSKDMSLTVEQPIYRGGATIASTKSAKNQVKASHENLRATENTVLLSAVQAYIDVIRDQAILELNIKNEEVLTKNLEATTARFEVGELTKTDVSQSEARLSNSKANVITARGNLNSSIAVYQSIIGESPADLQTPNVEKLKLPKSENEAIEMAMQNNPDIISASYLNEAGIAEIDNAYSNILPKVTLTGSVSKTYDPTKDIDDKEVSSIKANLSIPLYQSGQATSQIRQAKHNSNKRKIEIISNKKTVRSNTVSAWQDYQTAKSNTTARKDQIKANEIALNGVMEEELVGSRTILDVLDAEEDLLDSKVELVKAQRDTIFKSYELLSQVGNLTAKNLSLPTEYINAVDNYKKVKDKWWGVSID